MKEKDGVLLELPRTHNTRDFETADLPLHCMQHTPVAYKPFQIWRTTVAVSKGPWSVDYDAP